MAFSRPVLAISCPVDTTVQPFQFVVTDPAATNVTGIIPAGAGAEALGVTDDGGPYAAGGLAAPVAIAGAVQVVAGAAFSAGVALMTDANGNAIAWVTGTPAPPVVAYSQEAATAAGNIVYAVLA